MRQTKQKNLLSVYKDLVEPWIGKKRTLSEPTIKTLDDLLISVGSKNDVLNDFMLGTKNTNSVSKHHVFSRDVSIHELYEYLLPNSIINSFEKFKLWYNLRNIQVLISTEIHKKLVSSSKTLKTNNGKYKYNYYKFNTESKNKLKNIPLYSKKTKNEILINDTIFKSIDIRLKLYWNTQ